MFNQIELVNFKAFKKFVINFEENRSTRKAKNLALIYGCNGVGKTTIASAFGFLVDSLNAISRNINLTRLLSQDLEQMEASEIKERFISDIRDAQLSRRIANYKRLNSSEPMRMVFRNYIGKNSYIYETEYDDTSLLLETLKINGEIAFRADVRKLQNTFDDRHFKSETYKEKLLGLARMYVGNHTLLSCISYVNSELETSFLKEVLSDEIRAFLSEVERLEVVTKKGAIVYRPKRRGPHESGIDIREGVFTKKIAGALQQTERALSFFFSSLSDNIQSVIYKIETKAEGQQKYRLFFVETVEDGVLEIPYMLESTGNNSLLNIFGAFWNAKISDSILIVDEIESGISDIVLKEAFKALGNKLKGQIIATTHCTYLLSNLSSSSLSKNNVYILNREESMKVTAYSLDRFGRSIQKGTDVVGRFVKGTYGGIPHIKGFSFDDLVTLGTTEDHH